MSGISFIRRDQNDGVNIVRIIAANTLAQVGAVGYLTAQASNIAAFNNSTVGSPFDWQTQDMVLVYASDGWGFFTVSSDFTRLNAFAMSPNVIGTPVVIGDFAIFQSTSGNLEDLGYSPSDAAKTKVVMANGAVILNHIATYKDTAGTIGDDAATAINGGNIQAGLSGTAGTLISFPSTGSKGSLILAAVANTGNTNTTISNAAMGQASVISIPDPAQATANFILSESAGTQSIATGNLTLSAGNLAVTAGSIIATNGGVVQSGSSGHAGSLKVFPTTGSKGDLKITVSDQTGNTEVTLNAAAMGQATVLTLPDPGIAASSVDLSQSSAVAISNKVFVKTITATEAALASSGHVTVMAAPSGTAQFKIMNIRVMYAAAGLSGGGGDRLLNLTDGTIVFNQAGITAALLGTPVYTLWGGTGNPLPGAVSTISTAGASIYLVYAGGTTDYTTGQIVIEVELAQVAA